MVSHDVCVKSERVELTLQITAFSRGVIQGVRTGLSLDAHGSTLLRRIEMVPPVCLPGVGVDQLRRNGDCVAVAILEERSHHR